GGGPRRGRTLPRGRALEHPRRARRSVANRAAGILGEPTRSLIQSRDRAVVALPPLNGTSTVRAGRCIRPSEAAIPASEITTMLELERQPTSAHMHKWTAGGKRYAGTLRFG